MRFLNAYFSRSVDESIKVYEDLYLTSKDRNIKYLSTKKLYEYYYAQGLYIRASSLENAIKSFQLQSNESIPFETKQKYVIQCGVFGKESNALTLKEKIATLVINEVYLKKDVINGQEVIRVFIGNITSYQSAEQIKRSVDEKLSINTMIKLFEE